MHEPTHTQLMDTLTATLGGIFGMSWVNADGRIFEVNQRFTWLTGMGRSDAIGKPCPVIADRGGTLRAPRADGFWRGRYRQLDVILIPIGALPGYLVLLLGARQDADVQAAASLQLHGMAQRLSHEIGTRIASACMAADVLASRQTDRPGDLRLVHELKSRLISVTVLLDEVRYYARAGQLQFDDAVDPAAIVSDLFAQEAAIRWIPPTEAYHVRADPVALKDMLLRLVRNAVEAQEGGLPTDISLEADEAWVRIAVADQGNGIPSQDRQRIFEPFFTTKNCNLGLGLTVAKRTAEAHGGALLLRPGGGGGTVAEVFLPRL